MTCSGRTRGVGRVLHRVSMGALALPMLVASPSGSAKVLCQGRNGAVFARDEGCRRREIRLDPTALSIASAAHTHDERYYPKPEVDGKFLGAERVLSGSVQWAVEPIGTVLFRDPVTGLEIRSASLGRPRFINTNTDGVSLQVNGVGWFSPNNVYGYSATIEQGDAVTVTFDATGFGYGTFMVSKRVADGTSAPRLQVSCAFKDAPVAAQVVLSCVGVR